jgi:hypothetical protein
VVASLALAYLVGAGGIKVSAARESDKASQLRSHFDSANTTRATTLAEFDRAATTIELGVVPSSKPSRFLFTTMQLGLDPDSMDSTTFQTSCDCMDVRVIAYSRLDGTSRKLIEVVYKGSADTKADASNLLLVNCQAIDRGHKPRMFCLSLEVVSSPDL